MSPQVQLPQHVVERLQTLKDRIVTFERAWNERAYIAKRRAKQQRCHERIEEKKP